MKNKKAEVKTPVVTETAEVPDDAVTAKKKEELIKDIKKQIRALDRDLAENEKAIKEKKTALGEPNITDRAKMKLEFYLEDLQKAETAMKQKRADLTAQLPEGTTTKSGDIFASAIKEKKFVATDKSLAEKLRITEGQYRVLVINEAGEIAEIPLIKDNCPLTPYYKGHGAVAKAAKTAATSETTEAVNQ